MPDTGTADEDKHRPRPGEEAQEASAFGPLDIKRYLKDDGRALLLYTRRERGKP